MTFPSKYLSSLKTIDANYRPLRELDEVLSAQISAVMNDASKALINMATRTGVLKVSTDHFKLMLRSTLKAALCLCSLDGCVNLV